MTGFWCERAWLGDRIERVDLVRARAGGLLVEVSGMGSVAGDGSGSRSPVMLWARLLVTAGSMLR